MMRETENRKNLMGGGRATTNLLEREKKQKPMGTGQGTSTGEIGGTGSETLLGKSQFPVAKAAGDRKD